MLVKLVHATCPKLKCTRIIHIYYYSSAKNESALLLRTMRFTSGLKHTVKLQPSKAFYVIIKSKIYHIMMNFFMQNKL